MGLSMGACLALRLAELHGDAVRGLVLVNPSVTADTKLFLLAPVLKLVVPSLKGVGSDIKKPGVTELAYDRTPTKAAATLPGLWKVTERDLGKVTAPALVFKSTEDHVVGPASLAILRRDLPAVPARGQGARRQLSRRDPGQRRSGHLRRKPGFRSFSQPCGKGMTGWICWA